VYWGKGREREGKRKKGEKRGSTHRLTLSHQKGNRAFLLGLETAEEGGEEKEKKKDRPVLYLH